jgi:hypothetical protein
VRLVLLIAASQNVFLDVVDGQFRLVNLWPTPVVLGGCQGHRGFASGHWVGHSAASLERFRSKSLNLAGEMKRIRSCPQFSTALAKKQLT